MMDEWTDEQIGRPTDGDSQVNSQTLTEIDR